MTTADDAAERSRRTRRVVLPFRVGAVLVGLIGIGLRAGVIVAGLVALGSPLAIWAAATADRARFRRSLTPGVLGRAWASVHSATGARRFIGVLSVEGSRLQWTPSKHFRKRGATDVSVPQEHIDDMNAARISARWATWMARSDVLALDLDDRSIVVFLVTSPKVIYAALERAGHPVIVPEQRARVDLCLAFRSEECECDNVTQSAQRRLIS